MVEEDEVAYGIGEEERQPEDEDDGMGDGRHGRKRCLHGQEWRDASSYRSETILLAWVISREMIHLRFKRRPPRAR